MGPYMDFLFVRWIINKHGVISDFVVVVNSITILADIIFIILSLLLMTYEFPIHLMFYQENDIMEKY